ncbi:MAG TPA: pyruvate kinase [Candidatus Eisenbacteria bacterium]
MRRAKIVATLGPATREPKMIRRLIEAGMNVCRLNFSHGTHDEHQRTVESIHREARRLGATVAILQDLQGPKIRTGLMAAGEVLLKPGAPFVLTTRRVPGSAAIVSTTFEDLPREVTRGDQLLLADGLIQLEVAHVETTDVHTRVVDGGMLGSNKGINIPGRKLSVAALTPKDREDLKLGVRLGVDWMALSFVRSADDVRLLRSMLKRLKAPDLPVVAKLEKPQAIANLIEILGESDAVMVARGDLAVETSPEQVPVLQKRVIREARRRGVPVITATQMLESMIEHPRPTRAEASDVANAIYDGTDAVMLSAETAVGKYPVETVELMGRIIENVENELASNPRREAESASWWRKSVADAICEAAANAAEGLGAPVVAVFTETGNTARRVAQYRPGARLIAFSSSDRIRRRMALLWGVESRPAPAVSTTDRMVEWVAGALRKEGAIHPGDRIVVTAGTPVGQAGSTNFLKIHQVR